MVGKRRGVKQLTRKKLNALHGLNYTLSIRENRLCVEFNYSHQEGLNEIKKSWLYEIMNEE